jgi:dTDP-4-amino-4,6-dideoxygalactose transaminase
VIRIAQPLIGAEEEAAVLAALRSGQLAQGPRVAAFEEAFAAYTGVRHAVAVSSGTAALVVALRAHGIGAGDEVIVPTFTFAATANAVLLAGATPVLVDIGADDYTVDPERVEAALTPRTKAMVPVHLYGHPADMTALAEIARRRGLALIEDAAQALGATWRGTKAGSFGTGCFSFYATKNLTTGEGGMITTDDDGIARRARLLRNQGEEVRYRTDLLAGNERMTEVAAALGLTQLDKVDGWNERRRANAAWLSGRLEGVGTPVERAGARNVYSVYTVRVPEGRDALLAALREREIEAVVYYPLCVHQQPLYRELGIGGSFPVAERAAAEVLSLPIHPALSEDDRERIATAVNASLAAVGSRRG